MRKVFFWISTSLDGYVAGKNDETDWLVENETTDEAYKYFNEILSNVDTVLLGRVNYEGFHEYWSAVAKDSSNPKNEFEFANWLEDIPKIVFSRTLENADWKNSTLIKDNIEEEVAKLKQQDGKDIIIMNSSSIAQTLTNAGLVDEYRIKVHPIIVNGRKAAFENIKDVENLGLVNAKTFKTGVLGLYYKNKSR